MKRRIVYVCSPLRGDIEGNIARAKQYARLVYERGCLPIAPHVYFTTFLNDLQPEDRRGGMDMGLQMLTACDELWVFGGLISEGMRAEMELAQRIGLPVRHIGARWMSPAAELTLAVAH